MFRNLLTLAFTAAGLALSLPPRTAVAQTIYTYSGAAGGTWLNSNNWTGGLPSRYPGVDANATSTGDGTNTDIAAFGAVGTTTTATNININFSPSNGNTGIGNSATANGSLGLGTINFLATLNRPLSVTNSSTSTDGTLTLSGNVINTIPNTILANQGTQNVALTNGTRRMDLALGNPTDNVIQVNGAGNLTITSVIKNGSGSNLTLTSTGTPTGQLILNSPTANTFTGITTVDEGTMNLVTAGALGSTSGVTMNSGGTLLLSGVSTVTDRINNAAPITLSGGTLNTGGLSEGAATAAGAGIGALTLTANSTIDFATGNSILHFAGLGAHVPAAGPDLAIVNWSGLVSGGGTDRLLFTGSASDFTTRYDQTDVSFNGAQGYNFVQYTGFYEVTAVPEPSTYAAGVLAFAALGFSQRRRVAEALKRKTTAA